MKTFLALTTVGLLTCSCTTLNESLKLGAATGALAGASSTYAAQVSSGKPATLEDVAIGASIGLGIGMVVSYFVHQTVVEDRADNKRETEMYFGDLPPSPFVYPKTSRKGAF